MNNPEKIFTIIVAAGKGHRLEADIPKQYLPFGKYSMIYHCVQTFIENPHISNVICVIAEDDVDLYKKSIKDLKLLDPVFGGKTRKESVKNALEKIKQYNPDKVLIHDAARPFVSQDIINNIISELKNYKAVIPVIAVDETIKKCQNNKIESTIERKNLYRAQTPQAFIFKEILEQHANFQHLDVTDDAAIYEAASLEIKTINGSQNNFKITTQSDYQRALEMLKLNKEIRSGIGYDVHSLIALSKDESANNYIKIGGINVKYHKKFKAHSDGDVLIHAIIDSILGAIAGGDIGEYFPDNDQKFKNIDSVKMLKHILTLLKEKNAEINNLDCTIICEEPKILPYKKDINQKLAEILHISPSRINIKAKTNEKLGYLGRKEAIEAQAICLVNIYHNVQ